MTISVFCGQNLQISDVISLGLKKVPALIAYPEGDMGRKQLRGLTKKCVLDKLDYMFITRHEFIINDLGQLIEDGHISNKDVTINLFDEGKWSWWQFNEDGAMTDGWPFGVLGWGEE